MGGAVCCQDSYSGPPELRLAQKPIKKGSNFRIEPQIDVECNDYMGDINSPNYNSNSHSMVQIEATEPKVANYSPNFATKESTKKALAEEKEEQQSVVGNN